MLLLLRGRHGPQSKSPPVAEEAAQTLAFLGQRVERLTDVGVAGVHRLLDKIDVLRGMDITITTNAKSDAEGLALLQAFNFPFKDK